MLVGEGVSRVTVNGKPGTMLMESQTGWSRSSAVHGVADISDCLLQGENVLDLDVQNISAIGRFDLYLFQEQEQILDWKMKTFAEPNEVKNWTKADQSEVQTVYPRWYKSDFSWSPDNGPIVKVGLHHLSKGCFWVNGHCLGRYWNIGPQEDYKIPASILKEQNEIVIFDEEGKKPAQVVIHSHTPLVQQPDKRQFVSTITP